ncbi:MAG: hypothetical protein O7I93_15745 [Gemmatimonadetes bacterium]|nr:hypothetical protein [Gemmatimonadota bacterium]
MKRKFLQTLMCIPALAIWAPGALAQGTTKASKGELIWVGAPPADVTFDVTVTFDTTKAIKLVLNGIVMDFEGDKYPFADIDWDGTRINFSLTPGDGPVLCVLKRQEGERFAGHCPRDGPERDALIRITIDSLELPAVKSEEAGGRSLQRGGAPIH